MKLETTITRKVEIDFPNGLVAEVATRYFSEIAMDTYANLLAKGLDKKLMTGQKITGDPVSILDYGANMVIEDFILVERMEPHISELSSLDIKKGESYLGGHGRVFSPTELSRLTGIKIWRPTLMEAKIICPPMVDVHGRIYRSDLIGVVSMITIMDNIEWMIDPEERFALGDLKENVGWDRLKKLVPVNWNWPKEVPLVFERHRQKSFDTKTDTLLGLFLDRCILDEEITRAVGVHFYILPKQIKIKEEN
jgi:hypothetical protein